MEVSEFLNALVEKHENPRVYESRYLLHLGSDAPQNPPSLMHSLGITEDQLSPVATKTLAILEDANDESDKKDWEAFLWKLAAFDNIQDVFDMPLFGDDSFVRMSGLWYFYFESRQILIESILSGLNGFSLSSTSVLRTFLEFSLKQNYYWRITHSTGSYDALHNYFRDGRGPGNNTILRHAIPSDSFCAPIRFRIQQQLKGLSESSSHSYHPDRSPSRYRGYSVEQTVEGLFFWATTSLVVDSALWLYYANFPLLFFPKDLVEKFGFNPPVGNFILPPVAKCVRMSLSNSFEFFKEYAARKEETKDMLEWYDQQPTLSEGEIVSTWNSAEGPFPGVNAALGATMAQFRAIRAALSYPKDDRYSDVKDVPVDRFHSYGFWKQTANGRSKPKQSR